MKPLNQSKMKKEFVPYNLALRMKQIGFDEPCLGVYPVNGGDIILCGSTDRIRLKLKHIFAPTFSQAFRWFREKYGLYSYLSPKLSYLEAELACLEKLIEIVEQSKSE
jgi:hypothetical protein